MDVGAEAECAQVAVEHVTMDTSDKSRRAVGYRHPEASVLLRPDVGAQVQIRKKKAPIRYRYDSSLSPAIKREKGQSLSVELLGLDGPKYSTDPQGLGSRSC